MHSRLAPLGAGHPVSSKWSWLRSRWLPSVLAVVPALLTVWAASPPGGYFHIALVALGAWLVAGTLWLVMAVLAVRALPGPRRVHLGTLWPLLILPAVLTGLFPLTGSGAVNRAMFELHRPSLERLAADVATAPGRQLADQRVGLFAVPVAIADLDTGCTEIHIGDAGFLDATGFAHCPGRPPVDVPAGADGTRYYHLSDGWYRFSIVF